MADDDGPGNVRHLPRRGAQHARPPADPGEARPRRRLGRPTLLNEEVQQVIVGALKAGGTIRDAAAVAGVSEQAVHGWKARGMEALEAAGFIDGQEFDADLALEAIPPSEHQFVEFSWAIQGVASLRKVAWLDRINRDRDWRASAWLLKHYFPDDYGDRLDVGVTVDVEVHDPAAALRDRIERLRPGAIDALAVEEPPKKAAKRRKAVGPGEAARGRQTGS